MKHIPRSLNGLNFYEREVFLISFRDACIGAMYGNIEIGGRRDRKRYLLLFQESLGSVEVGFNERLSHKWSDCRRGEFGQAAFLLFDGTVAGLSVRTSRVVTSRFRLGPSVSRFEKARSSLLRSAQS